ncbi:hypothetical protein HispidOSU_003155 [Sigmodon hispidus]
MGLRGRDPLIATRTSLLPIAPAAPADFLEVTLPERPTLTSAKWLQPTLTSFCVTGSCFLRVVDSAISPPHNTTSSFLSASMMQTADEAVAGQETVLANDNLGQAKEVAGQI